MNTATIIPDIQFQIEPQSEQIQPTQHPQTYPTDSLPTIDIIFPTRNRQWIISTFLDHIYNLDYPKDKISIITYLNDSTDDSEKILNQFKKAHENEYNKINIYKYNLNTPTYTSGEGVRGGVEVVHQPMFGKSGVSRVVKRNTATKVYKSLAKIRNHLLHKVESDYAFSIDTDILCNKNTLLELLRHNKDFVSALICNGYIYANETNTDPYIYTNIMKLTDDKQNYIHIRDYEGKGIVSCDLTGAISLMSYKLCKSGAKYEVNKFGEDAGFCSSAQKLGFDIWCDTNIRLTHCMSEEYLNKYLSGEFVW